MATLSDAELQQARVDLAASFRWAVRHGFNEGICNHFSLAVGDDQFLINAHGYHWSEITASSIMLADYDGTIIDGDRDVERLEPVEQGAIRFIDHAAYDDDYAGLALDIDEGDRIATKMGNKSIMFMGAHGVTVTGSSVARTYDSLYYLERACQAQVLARSTGLPLRLLPDEVIERTRQQFAASNTDSAPLHFESLKRILDKEEPDYKS